MWGISSLNKNNGLKTRLFFLLSTISVTIITTDELVAQQYTLGMVFLSTQSF
jgi:hypothetical protein